MVIKTLMINLCKIILGNCITMKCNLYSLNLKLYLQAKTWPRNDHGGTSEKRFFI